MRKFLPLTVWQLTLAYALMMAGTSVMVMIAGIIGSRIAPSPGLATLPIALTIVGVASSTLPTGRLQILFGRKKVFVAYGFIAVAAALLASSSLVGGSFGGFCLAAVLMGWSAAAGHQYRFAAMENVPPELAPRATSVLVFGGILAAFIGPEAALRGRYLLASEFAGSYLLLACIYLLGILIIFFYRAAARPVGGHGSDGRPLHRIMRSPVVVLAVSAAAVGYAVMSFVMTAFPVSMHEHAGHDLRLTKWVLQSHIMAMYLPALVYPWLFSKLGYRGMLWWGLAAFALCLLIAAADTRWLHYWAAMVMLGIGWNFLFLSGTNLLRFGYRPRERFRVQSLNDFLVFTVQGAASLSSGWFLHHWGWQGLVYSAVPLVAAFALLLLWAGPRPGYFGDPGDDRGV